MATLAVEHARRKHAAQLAAIFSELLHTVSWLRCRLTFERPQSATELQEYFDTVKTALHEFYIEARSFSTPPHQRSAWNTEQVELTKFWVFAHWSSHELLLGRGRSTCIMTTATLIFRLVTI